MYYIGIMYGSGIRYDIGIRYDACIGYDSGSVIRYDSGIMHVNGIGITVLVLYVFQCYLHGSVSVCVSVIGMKVLVI